MGEDLSYQVVLRAYPADCQPQRIVFLGSAGGFSGARFWRLDTSRGTLCLRRWPLAHPSRERLEFIQAVLWHVHQEGFSKVPLPLETNAHRGYVRHDGHLWQLEPWLAGEAQREIEISGPRLRAAMETLAEFHRAASSFPLDVAAECPSPGIDERLAQLLALTDNGGQQRLTQAVAAAPMIFDSSAQRLLGLFPLVAPRVRALLEQAARWTVPLEPCFRDVWRDNVLFVGDEVSGLVDSGALRPESVAADVARLLGSLVEDRAQQRQAGLAAYETVRPLSAAELRLVTAFDASTTLLGGMQWLEWLYEQGREFDDPAAVQSRLDYFGRRLVTMTMKD